MRRDKSLLQLGIQWRLDKVYELVDTDPTVIRSLEDVRNIQSQILSTFGYCELITSLESILSHHHCLVTEAAYKAGLKDGVKLLGEIDSLTHEAPEPIAEKDIVNLAMVEWDEYDLPYDGMDDHVDKYIAIKRKFEGTFTGDQAIYFKGVQDADDELESVRNEAIFKDAFVAGYRACEKSRL